MLDPPSVTSTFLSYSDDGELFLRNCSLSLLTSPGSSRVASHGDGVNLARARVCFIFIFCTFLACACRLSLEPISTSSMRISGVGFSIYSMIMMMTEMLTDQVFVRREVSSMRCL